MARSRKRKRPPCGAASPTSPKRVRAAAKQAQAMQLREAGVSFEKIAEAVGYRDRGSARKAVMAGLKATRQEPAKHLRRLELRRLDKLGVQLWPLALAKPPDYAAIDRLLKIMQRRAALMGLDINKLALTNPTGAEEFSGANTNFVNIDWSALAKPVEVNEIEERLKQARASLVDPLPNTCPNGQNQPP